MIFTIDNVNNSNTDIESNCGKAVAVTDTINVGNYVLVATTLRVEYCFKPTVEIYISHHQIKAVLPNPVNNKAYYI